VISWCLPVVRPAREANRRETQLPSRSWAYVRTFGEEFVTRLRHGMEERLRELGFAALAPAVAPQCDVKVRTPVGLSSRWSERHVAFVAGLGTFGLSGGLITRRGIAHRLGSVVTSAEISPTLRPYGDDAFAWCLKLSRGTCGACIRRCPVSSIGETIQARDKSRCHEHAYKVITRRGRELFGWEGIYGCGLCQTAVPCEERNPTE
jgi:epoxyqueuosine reductase QueG